MSRPLTSTRRSVTDAAVTFGVLGPLEVRVGSRVLDVPGPQERALLALLLTAPGRVFSVSTIIAGIWGEESPGHAENTVQSYVSRLRRALPGHGASLVLTRRPGYLAAVDPEQVDAERFRTLAAAGRRELRAGRTEAAANELRGALALWRGEAYAEFDAPFAVAERTALEELRLTAVEDRIAADLTLGAGPELVSELETLVGQNPWRERLWAQLMTALYRSGRQGEALDAFQRARTSLIDELGVEPGPDLRAVEARVLAQDVALLAVDASPEALPPALTVVGPTFVGREAQLARLSDAYDRAATGSMERILLTGPHGMGKTRLLAELAREAQVRGGLVRHGISETWPEETGVPVVILLDDLHRASTEVLTGLMERVVGARPPLLVVGCCVWEDLKAEQTAALSRMFRDRMPVPPLQAPDIAKVVNLYVRPDAVGDGIAAVAEAKGVPLQVHAAASRYGEELAAAQVEEAAAGISGPRQRLSLSQDRVADGVLDLQRIQLVRAAHVPAEMPRVVCPYKGLAFFDVEDAPYFFGRERLVAQLVARLVDARLLAVVGASGSGKSSVVRAGLVAAIRAGVLPGSERWQTVLTTPTQPPPDLAADGARVLLVVDQFEELFTALPPMQQEEYADWLAGVAAEDKVTVVVAVRSDYYAQATTYGRVSDLLAANTVLVGEMASDELRQAVELPAAAAGLELEPGLAETIAGDVAGEPGGLPLMSTALLSLWERRDGRRLSLATYHELGGVRTAVARLAETAFGQLTPSQQSIARRTLLRMAETGEGGEPVRRRVPIAEVAANGDADARTVLDTLAARRLLTISETHAQVAHEALLREWPRLRGWLDEDEAGRQLRRHVAPAALGWRTSGDAGELYRGTRLAAAMDWLRDHADDLTEVEHDFLRTSREAAEAEEVRRRRSIRRLRGLAIGLATVMVLALAASLVALNLRTEADQSALRADVRALQGRALNENRLDRALLYAAQAQQLEPSDESRGALLEAVHRSPEATAILYADQALETVAASADGTKVVASGFEGTIYVWDTESRQRMTIPDTALFVESLDISPDGQHIAVVGVPVQYVQEDRYDSAVVLVDMEQSPPVSVLDGAEPASARFTADGRTIVTAGKDGRVRYVDVQTGAVKRTLDLALPEEAALVDAPENRRYMVAAAEPETRGPVLVWDVETGLEVWSSDASDSAVASISPDGSTLVIGHAGGPIEQVDLGAGGDRTPVPSALEDGLVDVAFSPDGSTFAGATQEGTVVVWDARTLEARTVLRGHSDQVTQAVYSPDGETIYASGSDRSVLAWDWNPTGTKGVVADLGGRPGPGVERTALAADGSVAATRYSDGRVNVFDITRNQSFDFEIHGYVDWLSVDRLGRYVGVFVHSESASRLYPTRVTVNVIDVRRQALMPHTFALDGRTAYAAEFTWDGQALVTAAQDRIDLWDLATGEKRSPDLYKAADGVPTLSLHPNGRLAALGGGAIEVIDLATGELEATLDPLASERFGVAPLFSPDGRWLAESYNSGRVVVWDTRSWQVHSMLEVDGDLVFAPDSRILFADGAIWSVEGASLGAIPDVDSSVGISDDGSTVVTFTEGTGIRRWNIAPERLLEHACTVAGRNLTQQEWDDVLPDRPYEHTCPQYPTGSRDSHF